MPLIAVAIENSNSRRQVSRENLPVHTEKILIRDTEVNPRAVIEINKKLVSFKRELAEDSVEKTENVLKKLKSDNSTSFKFAGNKIQYEFNEEISSNISKIKRAVKSCCYDRVLELCDILEHKVYKRNKCIKLAEKSPAGWDTVKEYLSDELASDSEDEKKMRSAEFRALRKRQQNKRKRIIPTGHQVLPLLILILFSTVIFVPFEDKEPQQILQTTVLPVTSKDIGEKTAPSQIKPLSPEQSRPHFQEIKDEYSNNFVFSKIAIENSNNYEYEQNKVVPILSVKNRNSKF
ncbi:hypothetical protein KUTeg_019460 [Tegillarca granosa]|uniref:Uncharacterized protein n=1 Tax=Tegillarca granosa TaxID=220873 RepID=A0ABQ9ECJ7_TEGGR|nr:hypothetical protein KUTeg_019460 [Tegillarca granosa]